MTHVLDALGRIKEYWGSVALADLADYARGSVIRGGAVAWEAYDASTLGAVLIGTGPDVISTTTPTFVGVVTFNAGITMGGASGVNVVTVPDSVAQALNLVDVGGLEHMRIVSTDANPYVLLYPAGGGYVGIGGVPTELFHAQGAGFHVGMMVEATTAHAAYSRFLTPTVEARQQAGVGDFFVGTLTNHPMSLVTNGAYRVTVAAGGFVNIGPTGTPATLLELERVETLVGNVADDYAACLTLDPGYTGAFTVTRHNYIDVNDVSVAGGAAVTDAAMMRFDAAIGTHKAVLAAFQTTDSGADTTNWALGLIINVLGTLYKIPAIAV